MGESSKNESLNSVGKLLALADLVRNYLLMDTKACEQDRLYKKYWLKLENNLPGILSNFIRDYMQVKEGVWIDTPSDQNNKRLYYRFKTIVKDMNSEAILNEMLEYSEYYVIVRNFDNDLVRSIDQHIRKRFEDFDRIKCTVVYPLTMVLTKAWKKEELSESEYIECLDVLLTYFIRRRIMKITQSENKAFPLFSRKIKEIISAPSKSDYIYQMLCTQGNCLRLPNDIELTTQLSSMNFFSLPYAKFILALIEEKISKIRPDLGNEKIQLEHIMPQTLNESWKQELGDEWSQVYDEFINNIGNLTLLTHNQELGNCPFSDKKEIYSSKEGMQIARSHITDRSQWNKESIVARRTWITQFLLDNVIPIPECYKKANNYKIEDKSKNNRNKNTFDKLDIIGEYISFKDDPSVQAKVVDSDHVEFEDTKYSLSKLTKELKTRLGNCNNSGSYQGALYWLYNGELLIDLFDQLRREEIED